MEETGTVNQGEVLVFEGKSFDGKPGEVLATRIDLGEA